MVAFPCRVFSLTFLELTKRLHRRNARQQFIEKYSEEILGTLSGFDRLVFRAAPRRLCSFYRDQGREIVVAKGMEEYATDPENRLVAGELERRWNQALQQVREVEVRIEQHEREAG